MLIMGFLSKITFYQLLFLENLMFLMKENRKKKLKNNLVKQNPFSTAGKCLGRKQKEQAFTHTKVSGYTLVSRFFYYRTALCLGMDAVARQPKKPEGTQRDALTC